MFEFNLLYSNTTFMIAQKCLKGRRIRKSAWLFAFLLSPGVVPAQIDDTKWYEVEVIIFAQNDVAAYDKERWPDLVEFPTGKTWELLPPLNFEISPESEPQIPDHFTQLTGDALLLNSLAERIASSSELRLMTHTGWRQSVEAGKRAKPAYIDDWGAEYSYQPRIPTPIPEQPEPAPEGTMAPPSDSPEALPSLEELIAQEEASLESPQAGALGAPPTDMELAEPLEEMPQGPSGPTEHHVFGTMSLKQTRYLHFSVDLAYRTAPQPAVAEETTATEVTFPMQGEEMAVTEETPPVEAMPLNRIPLDELFYRMRESRRIKNEKLYYFDHPMFGMVVQIRETEPPPEMVEEMPEEPMMEEPSPSEFIPRHQ